MGKLISTCSSSSKESSNAQITDSSTWFPQPDRHISMQTFRKLRAVQMSRPMWKKTETSLISEFSRSMADQLEEVSNLPTTHMPRQSIQGPKLRPSIF
ncbi:AC4 [Tomato leaf curl Bangalore virus - [India:Kerala IV:2005]]|nr:AC4 [Tomato leaf curl Bangalore virus - [India:Kerala IV:2005]]